MKDVDKNTFRQLQAAKRYIEARELVLKLEETTKTDHEIYYYLGLIHYLMSANIRDYLNRAIDYFERSIVLSAHYLPALLKLAQACGDSDPRAIHAYYTIITIHDRTPEQATPYIEVARKGLISGIAHQCGIPLTAITPENRALYNKGLADFFKVRVLRSQSQLNEALHRLSELEQENNQLIDIYHTQALRVEFIKFEYNVGVTLREWLGQIEDSYLSLYINTSFDEMVERLGDAISQDYVRDLKQINQKIGYCVCDERLHISPQLFEAFYNRIRSYQTRYERLLGTACALPLSCQEAKEKSGFTELKHLLEEQAHRLRELYQHVAMQLASNVEAHIYYLLIGKIFLSISDVETQTAGIIHEVVQQAEQAIREGKGSSSMLTQGIHRFRSLYNFNNDTSANLFCFLEGILFSGLAGRPVQEACRQVPLLELVLVVVVPEFLRLRVNTIECRAKWYYVADFKYVLENQSLLPNFLSGIARVLGVEDAQRAIVIASIEDVFRGVSRGHDEGSPFFDALCKCFPYMEALYQCRILQMSSLYSEPMSRLLELTSRDTSDYCASLRDIQRMNHSATRHILDSTTTMMLLAFFCTSQERVDHLLVSLLSYSARTRVEVDGEASCKPVFARPR